MGRDLGNPRAPWDWGCGQRVGTFLGPYQESGGDWEELNGSSFTWEKGFFF